MFDNIDWATGTLKQFSSLQWDEVKKVSSVLHPKMIFIMKELNSSISQCAEIVILNVINKPLSIWKKFVIQKGMGMVISQDVLLVEALWIDLFRQFFVQSDVWTVYLKRSRRGQSS